MKLQSRNQARTAGFTMVELMVVIAIIGLLVSLITFVATKAFATAARTQNRYEISQLEIALERFKSDFGIYPPSRIKLIETGAYDSANPLDVYSFQLLQRLWPQISFAGQRFGATGGVPGIDWNGNGVIDPATSPLGTMILEGDQCLVFFLGGIPENRPDAAKTPSFPPPLNCTGFATNPLDPSFHIVPLGTTVTTGLPRAKSPYYEFNTDRLLHPQEVSTSPKFTKVVAPVAYPAGAAGQRSVMHYSYLDGYTNRPYAFFSTQSRDGYFQNPFVVNLFDSDCRALRQVAGSATSMHVLPLIEQNPRVAGANPKFWKSESFQIISAGVDGQFGPGGDPVPPGTFAAWMTAGVYPTWTKTTVYKSSTPGWDDQVNFYGSRLGESEN